MPTAKNTDNTTNQAKCFVIIGLTYFFIQISFSVAYFFYTIIMRVTLDVCNVYGTHETCSIRMFMIILLYKKNIVFSSTNAKENGIIHTKVFFTRK